MMDKRSNICLFVFLSFFFFFIHFVLYLPHQGFFCTWGLVVFIALEGRQETTDRRVRQKGYCFVKSVMECLRARFVSLFHLFYFKHGSWGESVATARWVNFWLHNFSFFYLYSLSKV